MTFNNNDNQPLLRANIFLKSFQLSLIPTRGHMHIGSRRYLTALCPQNLAFETRSAERGWREMDLQECRYSGFLLSSFADILWDTMEAYDCWMLSCSRALVFLFFILARRDYFILLVIPGRGYFLFLSFLMRGHLHRAPFYIVAQS